MTLGAPQCNKLYRTVAYLACHDSDPDDPLPINTEQKALDNTWGLFSDRNVKAWDPTTRGYDRELYYYHMLNPAPAKTLQDLLTDGDAECEPWTDLLLAAWKANRITDVGKGYLDPVFAGAKTGWLLVQNAEFDHDDPQYPNSPPFLYGDSDVDVTPTGIPGQNVATPAQKRFKVHVNNWNIVVVDPESGETEQRIYDPSYGRTYDSITDFAVDALAGVGYSDTPEGPVHWMENTPQNREILFEILQYYVP